MHAGALERWTESTELVEHDAQRPDVALEGVGATFDDLRRKVVRGADHRPSHFDSVAKDSCNAEIAKFDDVLLCNKDILALDVSVEDLAVVDMLHAETDLSEPIHDLRLGEVPAALI